MLRFLVDGSAPAASAHSTPSRSQRSAAAWSALALACSGTIQLTTNSPSMEDWSRRMALAARGCDRRRCAGAFYVAIALAGLRSRKFAVLRIRVEFPVRGACSWQQEVLFALARRTEDLIDCRKLQIVLQSANLDLETKTFCSRAQEAVEFCPLIGTLGPLRHFLVIEASMFVAQALEVVRSSECIEQHKRAVRHAQPQL